MLTQEERIKCRYYLGYLNTSMAASLALGLPSVSQTAFLLESAMHMIIADAEFLVRRALAELDCIEAQLSGSRERYALRALDKTEFSQYEEIRLGDQFLHWSKTLADIFGVPINPFSLRHQMLNGEIMVINPA